MSSSVSGHNYSRDSFASLARHDSLSSSAPIGSATRASASQPQADLVVTTLDDVVDASDGVLSLREAITEANTLAGADTITFVESIRGGTIDLVAALPTITDDVTIDGDPLDGGAGGIAIENNATSDADKFERLFEVGAVAARFEDLSLGGYVGDTPSAIGAEDSALELERVDVGISGNAFTNGVRIAGGSVSVVNSTLSAVADEGGYALLFEDSDVVFDNSQVVDSGGEYGGGILGSGNFRMVDSSLVDSGGSVSGGALLVSGTIEIENSTFEGNQGGTFGPGGNPLALGGDVTIVNSTVGANRLYSGSGFAGPFAGTYIEPGSTVQIVNSAFSGTGEVTVGAFDPAYDTPVAGLRIGDGATVTLANSIIDDGIDGTIVSNGANTFRDAVVDGAVAGDQLGVAAEDVFATTEEIGTSGVFRGVLALNGGPTETIALSDDPTNPALDAADPVDAPVTDQRGFLRDATPDIGSFELDGQPFDRGLVVTTLDDVIAADGEISLREAVLTANTQTGADTITFDEALQGGTIRLASDLPTIVDDLAIDGDPADGGPGGVTILAETSLDDPSKVFFQQIIAARGAALQLEDLSLKAEIADDGAEGVNAIDSQLSLERVNLRVHGNPYALAISSSGGTLDIIDSTLSAGAEAGETLRFSGTDVSISGSSLYGGGAYGDGIVGTGTFRMADSLVTLGPYIQGKAFDVSGAINIKASTFAGSSGGSPGGVLFPSANAISMGGAVTIVNSTFANTGVLYAGLTSPPLAGLYFAPDSSVSIVNSTLTGTGEGEFADEGPALGMRVGQSAIVRIANSIIDDSIDGTIVSNGANTFRDAAVDGAVAGDRLGVSADEIFATTEEIGTTGVLRGVAADNGGPTETIALLDSASNPVLDAADPADAPPFDQRGLPRDATPDIGSFELQVQPPPANTLPPLAEKVPLPDSEIYGAPLFLVGPSGDAEISFVDEVAAFQSSLGVYLVGPDGTIGATEWAFERIEHSEASDEASNLARPGGGPLSPGDVLLLSDLFAPEELAPGTGFGLFLVADGAAENPFLVFDGGKLEFRSDGGPATVTDTTPDLVHVAENGLETLILGYILHTIDAGSANPLSNKLNPGDTGQVTSGLLDGQFTVAFEDEPLSQNSDRDFNDALFAVDAANTAPPIVAQASEPVADVQSKALVIEADPAIG